jgi:hypothetical protein
VSVSRGWKYLAAGAAYLIGAIFWELQWPSDRWMPLACAFGSGALLVIGVISCGIDRK